MAPERCREKTVRIKRPKSAEYFDVYREQTASFRRKFGREMGPDDPFFFDPDADTPQFRSPYEGWYAVDQIALIMGQAGVDPAETYAFRKTGGLFPTAERPLTDAQMKEWTRAVHEYRRKVVPIR